MWPFRKRTPEEYLYKLYKKNETMGTLGALAFRKLTLEEREHLAKYMLDLARITNFDRKIRTKALAALSYFTFNEKYRAISFPIDEIIKIVSENVDEFLNRFKNSGVSDTDINNNLSIIFELLSFCRKEEYKIKDQLFWDFYNLVIVNSGLRKNIENVSRPSIKEVLCKNFDDIIESGLYK
jgi:hypothetical protein